MKLTKKDGTFDTQILLKIVRDLDAFKYIGEAEHDELVNIFWSEEQGADSWILDDDGARWVHLTGGLYISEFGNLHEEKQDSESYQRNH